MCQVHFTRVRLHVPPSQTNRTHLVGSLSCHVQSGVAGVEGGAGGKGSGRADEEGGDSKLHGWIGGVNKPRQERNCEEIFGWHRQGNGGPMHEAVL